MSRILCVEDDPHLLRTLGANLRTRGYVVDLAYTRHYFRELSPVHLDFVALVAGLEGRRIAPQLRDDLFAQPLLAVAERIAV